jgi:hypothetical protein
MVKKLLSTLILGNNLRGDSNHWANWMSKLSPTTCLFCASKHGTIVSISVLEGKSIKYINKHPYCGCAYVPMRTLSVGLATTAGTAGADYALFYTGTLPNYYITKEDAYAAGWNPSLNNIHDVLPGKMIGGNEFYNRENKLPSAPERIWYEADINYDEGQRNRHRIVWSNDGLIFVTYDHYHTFYEII